MKITLRILAGIFVFVGPIIAIIIRYDSEKTVTTETGIGFFPTLIITLSILSIIGFVLSNFRKILRDDKFGALSLVTYGLILFSLIALSGILINWVINSATASVELFVENMTYHLNTIYIIGISMLAGIIILSFELLSKIKGD